MSVVCVRAAEMSELGVGGADAGGGLVAPPRQTASLSLARRVVRQPAPRRTRADVVPLSERVRLERVLGVTVNSNAAVDCSPSTGLTAYPAGCTVVLLSVRRSRWQTHLINPARRPFTAVQFSCDGQYVVTGESGRQPAVRVWHATQRQPLRHLHLHKYGVACVAFSPNNKYVVSVGFQHDNVVNVWDWQRNIKLASNKVSSRVCAVSFADNGSYFVTAGNRHVKFWYLDLSRSSKPKEAVPLTGRSAILGEQRNNLFCDVACGRGDTADSTFAVTRSGLLCEFNERRLLDKWVELRTEGAYCMTASERYIFIGCSDGIVRCFCPQTLQFITTLPRTHYLGVDVARCINISDMAHSPAGSRYPDCVGVCYDPAAAKLTCFYNDHSIYVWDVRNVRQVGKSLSFLYHSACIWGVDMYPQLASSSASSAATRRAPVIITNGGGGAEDSVTSSVSSTGPARACLPAGSFVTCSSDDTVRVWNLDTLPPTATPDTTVPRNIYSNELLKILYMDASLQHIKDAGDVTLCDPAERASTCSSTSTASSSNNAANSQDHAGYDCKNGVRCVNISPDGRFMASGDRQGNIRVHDLQVMEEQCKIEAHDVEVLCLQYSRPDTGLQLLASASRDRLIHLFNVQQDCQFVQTLDDHSSSITAVRFFQHQERAYMVSCGADKSVIFRHAVKTCDGDVQFALSHQVAGKTTLYDIEVDHSQRHILTACQDRNVRVYNVASGKHSRTFRGNLGDDGTLIKLALDDSGIYVATSCTDKTISIYDYYSGECMATMCGHSELVTGLKFTHDCRHLVSVSGDGCVFVWRVPHDMQQTMHARLQQQARRGRRRQTQSVPPIVPPPSSQGPGGSTAATTMPLRPASVPFSPDPSLDPGYDSTVNDRDLSDTDYRFSVGHLPQWAKKKVHSAASSPTGDRPMGDFPKGRWAQRVETAGMTVKSVHQHDSVIAFPSGCDSLRTSSAPDSEGSKDSSLEDTRTSLSKSPMMRAARSGELLESSRGRHHINDDSSDLGSYRLDEGTTDQDGDIDDYSEQESTGGHDTPETLPVYYPPTTSNTSDDPAGAHYTVNAMDQEELRRSVRRYRRSVRPSRLAVSSTTTGGGSDCVMIADAGDDEDDDTELNEDEYDAVSTPSADNEHKRVGTALSTSMESLDQTSRHGRFMSSTYESLDTCVDGAVNSALSCTTGENSTTVNDPVNTVIPDSPHSKSSISSRYHVQTSVSRSQDSVVRRQELQRRIQETRRKLQNVGYQCTMRSSQSVCDLRSVGGGVITGGGVRSVACTPRSSRRARVESGGASLLSCRGAVVGGGATDTGDDSDWGGGDAGGGDELSGGLRRAVSLSDLTDATTPRRIMPAPTAVSGRKSSSKKSRAPSTSMSRSSSMNALNQPVLSAGVGGVSGRLLRATIASSNRQASAVSATSLAARRLSNCVPSHDDISDAGGDISSEQLLSQFWHTDIDQLPLSGQVCEMTAAMMYRCCDRLVRLHRRLSHASSSSPSGSPTDEHLAAREMRAHLSAAAEHCVTSLSTLVTTSSSPPLPPAAAGAMTADSSCRQQADPAVLQMMQQYSDALLNIMQQKMQQPPASHPG